MKARKLATPCSSQAVAFTLWHRLGAVMGVSLAKAIHEFVSASFRKRIFTSRLTNVKTLVNSRCLSDRLVWR
ncbi:hypothetical protein [Butyricimonas virosa]|uniref:hypothetical protein n=1 Tax=Butyricimonas virosa TaxID=544645 RepID=UPI0024316F64|nr:hypothetical protein [Butyricimonas virosa]MBS5625001.1 hypothetical protein [Porphyromonadaceae bacterium]